MEQAYNASRFDNFSIHRDSCPRLFPERLQAEKALLNLPKNTEQF
jgi:hypothetical protein